MGEDHEDAAESESMLRLLHSQRIRATETNFRMQRILSSVRCNIPPRRNFAGGGLKAMLLDNYYSKGGSSASHGTHVLS